MAVTETTEKTRSRTDRGSAVQRTFALLEMIVSENRPMSLAQMAERLALPKPTVHRLASRLESEGLLAREPSGKQFTIGPRLNALAVDTLTASAQRAPRHAVLESLAEETGETCNLGMLDGNRVVYLDRVETHWPLRLQLSVGSHVPLHCSAMGKLFLSHMAKRTRERIYAAGPLERYTEQTIVDTTALEAELETIKAEDVAINNQEYMIGLVGMAVPVPDPARDGRFTAALAIHAPEARFDAAAIRTCLPALQLAAKRLGAVMAEPA
ncbi:MAG: IclR family transcriptional regulator [Alphaproteobacteria bacterium]|nr:IclR family transcriptional regulator [Alphaproteobacteria bacterium]